MARKTFRDGVKTDTENEESSSGAATTEKTVYSSFTECSNCSQEVTQGDETIGENGNPHCPECGATLPS